MATSPGALPQAASVAVVREGREPSREQEEKQGSDGSETEGVSRPSSAMTCRQHHGQRCHCWGCENTCEGKDGGFHFGLAHCASLGVLICVAAVLLFFVLFSCQA